MRHSLFQRVSGFARNLIAVCTWVLSVGVFYAVLAVDGATWVQEWRLPLAFLCACGSAWLGWAIRQAWIYPLWLRKAEALWALDGYASEVVDLLSGLHLAAGELGYRVWLLRAKANLALGFRNLAWAESEEAHLARVPFWLRPFLRSYLHSLPGCSRASLQRSSGIWLRLAPRMPRLKWGLAVHFLRLDNLEDRDRAWNLVLGAVPHAVEDPLLLEEVMLALLGRVEEQETVSDSAPDLERVLHLLLHGHGYSRLGWDRVPPALYLLRRKRCAEVLALGLSLPADLYPETLWVAVIVARKGLGDLEGAWLGSGQALAIQPDSFRLWMMREDLALELHRNPEALEALERTEGFFRDGGPMEQIREWHTRRAEFAYWIENDSEEASRHLAYLPASVDTEGRPPLRLLILLDLGHHEDVHREVALLLAARPDDPDLQLIQAESLGGMQAWESLRERLEAMSEQAMRRPDFWHLRGICRSHLGDPLRAREDLETSAQMAPDNLRYVLDAGHACAELGEWERSEQHWRQVLRQDDRNEEAFIELAETRRMLHDPEASKRLLRECLNHHPDSGPAQALLAELEAN